MMTRRPKSHTSIIHKYRTQYQVCQMKRLISDTNQSIERTQQHTSAHNTCHKVSLALGRNSKFGANLTWVAGWKSAAKVCKVRVYFKQTHRHTHAYMYKYDTLMRMCYTCAYVCAYIERICAAYGPNIQATKTPNRQPMAPKHIHKYFHIFVPTERENGVRRSVCAFNVANL